MKEGKKIDLKKFDVKKTDIKKLFLIISICFFSILLGIAIFSTYYLSKSKVEFKNNQEKYTNDISQLQAGGSVLEDSIENKNVQLDMLLKQAAAEQESEVPGNQELESQEEQDLLWGKDVEIADLEAGALVEGEDILKENLEQYFMAYEIQEGDAVYNRIIGKSYYDNLDIGLSDLRYLKMLHYNFNHEIQVGEMIVNTDVAQNVLQIFKELFTKGYEINTMYLIDNYWTGNGIDSDTASIQENNTSAFCYRYSTADNGSLSNHAYGHAIDLNPQQNPYITYNDQGMPETFHSNAVPYIDREGGDPHMIIGGDVCCQIFEKYGFSWGGYWSNPVDYQHFEYVY